MRNPKKLEKLETKAAFYDFMFDRCDNGLVFVGADQKIIAYNRMMEDIEGLKREDVCGKTVKEVYITDEYTDKVFKTKKPVTNIHNLFRSRHGRQIQLLSNYYPVFKGGVFYGVCVISTNQNILQRLLDETYVSLPKSGKHTDLYAFDDIVGKSERLKAALREARTAARTAGNVMVLGETGVGKEMFVQSIHSAGASPGAPFVPINCSAIPENLLEGLLFGTTKGAFTGAENKVGLIEQAKSGTLYLDELNSMPVSLQAKLLRVIQEKTIRRLGGKETMSIDCRFIASINEDPAKAVENNTLRKDLFYRLATLTVDIPSLRQRRDDLPLLSDHFIRRSNLKYGLNIKGADQRLMAAFDRYFWPGNVREFQHVVESSAILAGEAEYLTLDCLNSYNRKMLFSLTETTALQNDYGPDAPQAFDDTRPLNTILIETEKIVLEAAMKKSNGNVTKAAQALGISRQNLNYRLRKLRIMRHQLTQQRLEP